LLAAGLVIVLGIIAILGVQLSAVPASGHHTPPVDPTAVARLASPIAADFGPEQPVVFDFSVAMDRASVDAVVTVDPPAPVRPVWDAAAKTLTLMPEGTWTPGTFYTVSVGTGARSQAGQPLAAPLRAVFLTLAAPQVKASATQMSGNRALPGTGIALDFSRPVDLASLRAGFKVTPAVAGAFAVSLARSAPYRVTFVPAKALAPGSTYVVTFAAPVRTLDGMAVSAPRLTFRTTSRPGVVRFRPMNRTQSVDPTAAVSVRFTQPMNRASTQSAFRLSSVPAKAGKFTWVENDTVLVFQPAKPLQYGRAYVVMVTDAARARDGGVLATVKGSRDVRSAFRVAAKPQLATVTKPSPSVAKTSAPAPGGSVRTTQPPATTPVSGAPWGSVEEYALSLLNCTRTGGWVLANGTCDGYGSGKYSAYVPPLTLNAGISSSVTRPYARLQAEQRACSHFLDGTPGTRLARAGYTSYRWGENIGCSSGSPSSIAVATELFFQSEKSYNGGHWANLKNGEFSEVGVGVWVAGGYTLVVFDFYHP